MLADACKEFLSQHWYKVSFVDSLIVIIKHSEHVPQSSLLHHLLVHHRCLHNLLLIHHHLLWCVFLMMIDIPDHRVEREAGVHPGVGPIRNIIICRNIIDQVVFVFAERIVCSRIGDEARQTLYRGHRDDEEECCSCCGDHDSDANDDHQTHVIFIRCNILVLMVEQPVHTVNI